MSPSNSADSTYPWRYRRLVVFFTLAFCFAGITWLTLKGADTRLAETLALGYFGLAGATIGAYVFGAVWHDTGLMGLSARRQMSQLDPKDTEAGTSVA